MGLFSSNKNLCPFCGDSTPRLLKTKVEGQPICSGCALKINAGAPSDANLTVSKAREVIQLYDANQPLRDTFCISKKMDFGFLGTKIIIDTNNNLFCFSGKPDKYVFKGEELVSITIKEDNSPIFIINKDGFQRIQSTVTDRVSALAPQFALIALADRMADMNKTDEQKNQYHSHPHIREPFDNFQCEIIVKHPFWSCITFSESGPNFDNERPDADDYICEYTRQYEEFMDLATSLMEIAFPNAPVYTSGGSIPIMAGIAPAQSVANVDAIEEIRKYKELMTQGIITEEEFSAKKKQLLGI